MKDYFIHYTFIENGKSGDGNIDVKADRGIENIDDIREMEVVLKAKHGYESIVITNFIQF